LPKIMLNPRYEFRVFLAVFDCANLHRYNGFKP